MNANDNPSPRSATIEAVSRLLRIAVLLLMVLLPAAAIYALLFGGITAESHEMRFMRFGGPGEERMMMGPGGAMPMPGMPMSPEAIMPPGEPGAMMLAPGMPADGKRRIVTTQCTDNGGTRTCTTTERELQPGEALPQIPGQTAPQPAPGSGNVRPQAFPAAPQQPNLVPAAYTVSTYGVSNSTTTTEAAADTSAPAAAPPADHAVPGAPAKPPASQAQTAPPHARWFGMTPPPARIGFTTAFAVVSLLLMLGLLYNFERLLAAFETGSVFSAETVKRLQRAGLIVAAMAFVPQLDYFAIIGNALASLMHGLPVPPLAVVLPHGIDVPLLLAGLFTILIARVVNEAVWLADEVKATV